jgi:hypothetical protein
MSSRRLALVVLTALIGCDGPGMDSSAGVVRDSAGIRVVEVPSLADDRTVTELSIDPTWAIGGDGVFGWGPQDDEESIAPIPDQRRLLNDRNLMNRIAKLAAYRRFLLWQMEAEIAKTKTLRLEIFRSAR